MRAQKEQYHLQRHFPLILGVTERYQSPRYCKFSLTHCKANSIKHSDVYVIWREVGIPVRHKLSTLHVFLA